MPDLELAQPVVSRAGRDKGRLYLVVRVLDSGMVEVADGRARPVARPKKKNSRHLVACGQPAAAVGVRLKSKQVPSDEEVRDALAAVEAAGAGKRQRVSSEEVDGADGQA